MHTLDAQNVLSQASHQQRYIWRDLACTTAGRHMARVGIQSCSKTVTPLPLYVGKLGSLETVWGFRKHSEDGHGNVDGSRFCLAWWKKGATRYSTYIEMIDVYDKHVRISTTRLAIQMNICWHFGHIRVSKQTRIEDAHRRKLWDRIREFFDIRATVATQTPRRNSKCDTH